MNEITLTQILAWIVAANTIITFGTAIYNLMSTRATKALKAIEGLEQKIGKLGAERQAASDQAGERFQHMENRLLKIEADIEHMPDRKQAHDLAMAVEKMSGQIAAMEAKLSGRIDTLDERLKPVDTLGRRIQEMLVRQAEKG